MLTGEVACYIETLFLYPARRGGRAAGWPDMDRPDGIKAVRFSTRPDPRKHRNIGWLCFKDNDAQAGGSQQTRSRGAAGQEGAVNAWTPLSHPELWILV